MTQDDMPHSRVAGNIIRSRGGVPRAYRSDGGNDAMAYQAAIISDGFPHMGFSVFCADGSRHGFLYHNLENLELKDGDHGSYLKLTHRGKAATLRGKHLHEMFQAIMEHTLQAIYEFDPNAYPDVQTDDPIIDWVSIVDVTAPPVEPPEGLTGSASA